MTFKDVLENRYSCRNYADRSVEKDILEAIMEDGKTSPSACNSQRWHFIAVDQPDIKQELVASLLDEENRVNLFVGEVPAFIVISNRKIEAGKRQQVLLGEGLANWEDVDVGIAAAFMTLSATSRGLASIIIGHMDANRVAKALELPEDVEPKVIICIGYEKEKKDRKHIRVESQEVIHFNSL